MRPVLSGGMSEKSKTQRVAHATLDDPRGLAKTGVVQEEIGDDESGVVIADWGEDGLVGYDRREMVPLLNHSDSSPVILRPRHLWALLKTPFGAVSVLLALAVGLLLAYMRSVQHWDKTTVLGAGVGMLIVALVCLLFVEARMRRRAQREADADSK